MRLSVRSRMILLIVGPTLLIFVLGFALAMDLLCENARADLEHQMVHLAQNYAARFDGVFRELATIAGTTADIMTTGPGLTESQIYKVLRANVQRSDAVYGAAMAFVPGTFKQDDSLFCPYVHRSDDGLREMNIDRRAYDWFADPQCQWWQIPYETGEAVWTDPYFDEGAGNVVMVTYSVPFLRNGKILGVTTVDVMLTTLNATIGQAIRDDLDFVILSQEGQFIYSADKDRIMKANVFDMAQEYHRPDIAEVARKVVSGGTGVAVMPPMGRDSTEPLCMFYAPIRAADWGFAALLPAREVLAGVRAQMKVAAAAMAVTLLIIVALVLYVSGRITRPIAKLRSEVLSIADGKLNARVAGVTSRDEIGELARSFNTMAENLCAVVGQVRQSSIQLHSTVTELTATSREQEATTASFGASAGQIAASAAQISATNSDLVQTMNQVNQVATETAQLAADGRENLKAMACTMQGLEDATREFAEKLSTINTKAANITGVVSTINKVADQTNLLSVNAAIEAEKAGDYGVGFLVVAREIRRLADQTAAATLDIRQMVKAMQGAVSSGVMEMDRFAEHVRRSVADAALIAQQMSEIIEQVDVNTASFERIVEGMQQQSAGADQISSAMRDLTGSADRTMEATREYVHAANDLRNAIDALKASIAAFELTC